jgi:uncharacterized protein YcbX
MMYITKMCNVYPLKRMTAMRQGAKLIPNSNLANDRVSSMEVQQNVTPTEPQIPLKTILDNAALVRTYRPCPRIFDDSEGGPLRSS